MAVLLREVRGDSLYTARGTEHKLVSTPRRAEAAWWVADEDGVVAYAVAMRRWWRASNEAYAWVGVLPEARGRGLGSALWQLAEWHVSKLGVDSLLSDVVDDAAGEAFLRGRGFQPGRVDRVSALDPRTVDVAELEQRTQRASAGGYALLSLGEVADLRALYELAVEVADDMPGSEGEHTFAFEEWRHELLDDPDLNAEASAVVVHAGRPVSLALLSVELEGRRARNEETGTARVHRRRGLATLAKLATIRWAREHRIASIITDNAEENAAMLAINQRLGYEPFARRQRWVRSSLHRQEVPLLRCDQTRQLRRSVSVDSISAVGFARGAELYERVRPEYPAEAVDWALERLGLRRGAVVLDLAAGTGKLTRALVARRLRVMAVDPSPEMLARLRAVLPAVDAREGTAEAIPLEDEAVDAVTVAQAFHWFEPQAALREIHRVLRPNGGLALFWNSRELDDPVQAAWGEIVREAKGSVLEREAFDERAEIAGSGLFGPLEEQEHGWEQHLGIDEFVDLVGSRSYVARLDDPERERILGRVRALAERLGEPIPFRYVTCVQVARRLDRGSRSPVN